MHSILEIFDNRILLPTVAAWFFAQLLKVVFTRVLHKRNDPSRFLGSGGMPSSHSASVVSLAISVGLYNGFDSALFAISLIFAIIVMTDAAGVRLAASKQAKLLNEIALSIANEGEVPREKLKELLGHTPVEVIAGALVGLCMALLFS